MDISGSPGYDLLSDKEKELCSNLRYASLINLYWIYCYDYRLYPHQYKLIKDTLLRESMKSGQLKKQVARQLVKIGKEYTRSCRLLIQSIDVNKTSKIFDFFESNGWINKAVPTEEVLPPFYEQQQPQQTPSVAAQTLTQSIATEHSSNANGMQVTT